MQDITQLIEKYRVNKDTVRLPTRDIFGGRVKPKSIYALAKLLCTYFKYIIIVRRTQTVIYATNSDEFKQTLENYFKNVKKSNMRIYVCR